MSEISAGSGTVTAAVGSQLRRVCGTATAVALGISGLLGMTSCTPSGAGAGAAGAASSVCTSINTALRDATGHDLTGLLAMVPADLKNMDTAAAVSRYRKGSDALQGLAKRTAGSADGSAVAAKASSLSVPMKSLADDFGSIQHDPAKVFAAAKPLASLIASAVSCS